MANKTRSKKQDLGNKKEEKNVLKKDKKSTEKEKKTVKENKISKKSMGLTMEELLSSAKEGSFGIKKGDKVKGRITTIRNRSIFIDIGAKSDAVVDGDEFDFVKDYLSDLKIGDEIEVNIKVPESDKGQILVSMKDAANEYGWQYFESKVNTDETVTVFGKELNRGGAVVIAPFGFFGFIPGSQIGDKYDGDPEKMIGKKVKVKVLEVDQSKNRLVFSERLVSEPNVVNLEEKAAKELEIGAVFESKIVRVEPFGLFVHIEIDVGEDRKATLEGLVHISEISWEKVEKVDELYRAGTTIEVKLINKDEGRLQFSIKRLQPDPWENIDKKYPKDEEFEGVVTKIASYGALVRMEPGVEGLVHISKLTGGITFAQGDKIKVYIESIDVPKRKMSLGLVVSDKSKVIYK